jgi:hypothetical protein
MDDSRGRRPSGTNKRRRGRYSKTLFNKFRKEDMMKEFAIAAKAGGKKMTTFGVIAIILGILTMLMPGLTRISVVFFLGVLVQLAGIVHHLGFPGGQPREGAAAVRYWRADLALRYCTGCQSAVWIRRPDDHAGAVLHP